MVYYNKIALIQQIWYVHVFSWSLICSPNVRKKCKKMCQKISRKIYRKKQSRINARKGVRRYVRRMIADMSEYICQKPCQRICQQFQKTGQDIYLSLSIYIYMYISSECMSGQRNGQEICQDIRQDVVTYCGWKKSCTTLDGWNPINNGIIHLSTGAGFLPSTVCQHWKFVTGWWHKARRNSPRRLLGGWRASAMQTLGTWCTRRWCPRSLAKLVYHCQNLSLW